MIFYQLQCVTTDILVCTYSVQYIPLNNFLMTSCKAFKVCKRISAWVGRLRDITECTYTFDYRRFVEIESAGKNSRTQVEALTEALQELPVVRKLDLRGNDVITIQVSGEDNGRLIRKRAEYSPRKKRS